MRLDLRLPARPPSVAAARHALWELSSFLDRDKLETAMLLVTELVTNSIRHGGLSEDQTIEVSIQAWNGSVRAEVIDDGKAFPARVTDEAQRGESGWGLYLVEQLSNRWGIVRDGRNRVWFETGEWSRRPDPSRI